MLRLTQFIKQYEGTISDRLILPFELRQKSRFKTQTEAGREVGIMIPRGNVIRHRHVLLSEDGTAVQVIAQAEPVITAYAASSRQLAQASYHLGNRHVPLQIGNNWVRFQPDHVLQEMVDLLGLSSQREQAPFEPEEGAYHGHGHQHH